MGGEKVLSIEDLVLYYRTRKGYVRAVENVSLDIYRGEAVGIVGESGCGKTTLAMAIMKLLPPNAEIRQGRIVFLGTDIVPLTEEEMRKIRWAKISMIFQAAMNALNPVYTVGWQIVEAIKTHKPKISDDEAWAKVKELFELVGIQPGRSKDYPHEFSGGMKQRAIIAMALALNPDLIIADEPTTALDVIVQDQILSEIQNLRKKFNMTMMLISHDIAMVAENVDRIAVMYAGQLVEVAEVHELYRNPLHPYTVGLLSSYPRLRGSLKRLNPIPGEPPNLLDPPSGCRFWPRCPHAKEICKRKVPEIVKVSDGHLVACHKVSAGEAWGK